MCPYLECFWAITRYSAYDDCRWPRALQCKDGIQYYRYRAAYFVTLSSWFQWMVNRVCCREKLIWQNKDQKKSCQEAIWIIFAVQVGWSKFKRDHLIRCRLHYSHTTCLVWLYPQYIRIFDHLSSTLSAWHEFAFFQFWNNLQLYWGCMILLIAMLCHGEFGWYINPDPGLIPGYPIPISATKVAGLKEEFLDCKRKTVVCSIAGPGRTSFCRKNDSLPEPSLFGL